MTLVAGIELADLIALRSLDRGQIAARFGLRRSVADVAYEGIRGVERVDTDDPVMHVYFRGQEQVMLYVPRTTLVDVDPSAIEAELGEPEGVLGSRAGKDSRLLVWPRRGVALSSDGADAEILEIFTPTTLDRYRADIHEEPGPFIR